MIDGTEKRKPGRPRKAINLGCEERDVGDASLEKVEKYADSIFDVMTKQKPFAEHFKHLDLTKGKQLARVLAHELCYFPLLNELVFKTNAGLTGPRPKTAQSIFITQVKEKLAASEVVLPQWKNNIGGKDVLITFCMKLATATQTQGLRPSMRTVRNAPKVGFRALE